MTDPTTLGLFCAAALALLVVPGPSVLYIVARSIEQGRSAGLLSTLGVHVGTLVHIAAAVFGVSALVVSSATAFDAVRYAGAVYLFVLGVRALLGRGDAALGCEAALARAPADLRNGLLGLLIAAPAAGPD